MRANTVALPFAGPRAFCVRASPRGSAVRPFFWDGRCRRPSDINCRRVDHVLNVRGVEFFDHFHAGAAVLGYLINVSTLHQP